MCITPGSDYLFKVHDDRRKLDKEMVEAFHHTVYQLFVAANRAMRNIQMAVLFLTTRVKAPDKDDWGKLRVRVMKYLNGTGYMELILSANEINFTVHWYVTSSPQRLQRTDWMPNDDGKESCNQLIKHHEMQY